jgi:hypothetical protein
MSDAQNYLDSLDTQDFDPIRDVANVGAIADTKAGARMEKVPTARISFVRFTFLFLVSLVTLFTVFHWGGMIRLDKAKEVLGSSETRELVFSDPTLQIYNKLRIAVVEDNKPKSIKSYKVEKRWYFEEEKSQDINDIKTETILGIPLKSGLDIFQIKSVDSSVEKDLRAAVGVADDFSQKITGCENQEWIKMSNNNVLPINYYYTVKNGDLFLAKHYLQTSAVKLNFSLKNICIR